MEVCGNGRMGIKYVYLHALPPQLMCAGVGLPVDSDSTHNLWVACCDGYGGQVCLLDLHTSTQPHMVANITVSDSKILCISAVPTEDEAGGDTQREEERLPLADEIEEGDVPAEAPLDNCADSGLDVTHPGLDGKTSQSLPRALRGSLVASFSSDSSSTGRSVSRTPSINSTRSEEPRADTCSDVEMVGVASDVLDAGPTPSDRFRGHDEGGQRKKNGFHRVCSNSAPDLLKVVAGGSPTEEVFRRNVERVATSLSPPPPVDSKFWSPLTLHPGPLEGDKGEASEGRRTSMWLGTEGGQILVYSPGSSLRSRSNRTTIHLPAAVLCIGYIYIHMTLDGVSSWVTGYPVDCQASGWLYIEHYLMPFFLQVSQTQSVCRTCRRKTGCV